MRLPYMALRSTSLIREVPVADDGFYIVIDRETNETVVWRLSPGSSLDVYRSPKPENAIRNYASAELRIKRVYLVGFSEIEETRLVRDLMNNHGIELEQFVPAF